MRLLSRKTRAWAWRLSLLVILPACGTTTDSSASQPAAEAADTRLVESSACRVFTAIFWSKDDLVRHPDGSNPTLAAIKGHNAVWKALCGPPAPPPY